ncbi:MAG: SGNH/GDSL hydrolase family protein [Roseivirga sp.]|nr:SGNH/GDSL hydrolase family protein [Roseivirga sp.]
MKVYLKRIIYILLIALVVLELTLRLMGYGPPPERPQAISFYEPNAHLGWTQTPGTYRFPVNIWGDTMNLTIDRYGERLTKPEPIPGNLDQVLFIGGSFTMGAGLDDEQTLPWKLQQEFPSVNIRNLGVGGYGTYQSLLVLRKRLEHSKKPKAVIYGFMSHHRQRNVAQADWLGSLAINSNKSGNEQVYIPFVTLTKDKKLIEGKPVKYLRLPLHKHLASSFLLQRAINNISGYRRIHDTDEVLELLLSEMHDLCSKLDIPFYVNLLHCEKLMLSGLQEFLDQNNIAYIDSRVSLNENNTFRDDGHPKEVVIEEWTKRVSQRFLKDGIVSAEVK